MAPQLNSRVMYQEGWNSSTWCLYVMIYCLIFKMNWVMNMTLELTIKLP